MKTSAELLDHFRRDRSRGVNDDIDLTLRPAYRDLLAALGNPQEKLPPVFHVAGTNGKGSACAFLRAMLEASGYRVHVYTSPHLITFHERIRIAGKYIAEAELVEWLELCLKHASGHVTFFEAATAVAFAAFSRTPADYTIVEVGLGGRLDATNVMPQPLATLITRLSLDHREYLGDTIEKIAFEKAGIMKPGTPCFAMAQPESGAMQILRDHAQKTGSPLRIAEKDWQIRKTKTGFTYTDAKGTLELPPPALLGDHQYDNAALSIAALRLTRSVTDGTRIAAGLQNVEWNARLQNINTGALHALMPKGWELWLDGGHNDSAGSALAVQMKQWQEADKKPLHLVCGMLATKKPAEFLAPLKPWVKSFTAVPIEDEIAAMAPLDLAAIAASTGLYHCGVAASLREALRKITSSGETSRVLITGSLYLAGHVLAENNSAQ